MFTVFCLFDVSFNVCGHIILIMRLKITVIKSLFVAFKRVCVCARVRAYVQDNATTSTSNFLVTTPAEECGEPLIIRGLWPSRSPDLNTWDYCL